DFTGYEIHMGRGEKTSPVLSSGNVYGSYIHGLFDAKGVADAVLRCICKAKGVEFSSLGSFDVSEYKERQYDLLARGVRDALDMELIYRTIGI
ncbi:MAG: cobyric acid synthase CobQ, partial [Oscillospiraceae bacterium]|nr:cobyric acid synthase CobQ [Oscillospiraceae bacterium]